MTLQYGAWIYPGAPATNAPLTYRTNHIDVLRPQYFTLQADGTLKLLTENQSDLVDTANAFSQNNIKDIQAHSTEQYVTVAGNDLASLRILFQNPLPTIKMLCRFLVQYNMTGIDIDFEGIGGWTTKDFTNYKSFLSDLGTRLHMYHKRLTVCTPVWTTDPHSPPFVWHYPDLVSLPIDGITAMVYDYQWDYGAGTPVTPISWLTTWATYLLSIVGPDRLIIGIPSYGYTGTKGKYNIANKTLDQIKAAGKYDTTKRDAESGEIINVSTDGTVWVANDTYSLDKKRDALVKCGVTKVCVWHLGGNAWF